MPFGDEVAVAVEHEDRTAATTEDPTTAYESVRCESRAWNRITKGKRAKDAADYALIASLDVKSFTTDNEAAATITSQGHSITFDPDTKVPVKEVFYVATAPPGMVDSEIGIVPILCSSK